MKESKKLLLTCTELMLIQFMIPHLENLSKNGFEIDLACSEVGGRFQEMTEKAKKYINKAFKISAHRSPFTIDNIRGYKQLKEIIKNNNYDIVWTNEPVMGVITRLAVKSSNTHPCVMYMTHGFHFYRGSSLLSWLLYYPIEKLMSIITDMIVTINNEDFHLATNKMKCMSVKYIHGIGIDMKKFDSIMVDKATKRKEFSIPEDAILLLSAGELATRKNHEVIIKALQRIDCRNIYYIICGDGKLKNKYHELIKEFHLEKNIILAGYRRDVLEWCKVSDIFVHPSIREGLGIAALEGMACGLPLISSNINGILDYSINGVTGYSCNPFDIQKFSESIQTLACNKNLRIKMGKEAKSKAKEFDIEISKCEVKDCIQACYNFCRY